jgi:hypothetical protein
MSRQPHIAESSEHGMSNEVYFNRANPDAGIFIKIEESKAIEMGMTVIETTVDHVIVGCTGSEYLITEPRTFAFVEITNDDRFTITAWKESDGKVVFE